LKKLGELSRGIHDEITSQNRMLDDLEADVDQGQTNLEIVTKKVDDVIKKAG
jgi:hypothetical protein